MIKNIKIISIILVVGCFGIILLTNFNETKDKIIQNRIIDNLFSIDTSTNNADTKKENITEYKGYIYIPKYNIKRLIKYGTTLDILDNNYVGMYYKSGNLNEDNLIILAGHNIKTVFSSLHKINIGDAVYINGYNLNRKFIVYKKLVVDEYNNDYFYNRTHELLLITCGEKGKRLLVFLEEEI